MRLILFLLCVAAIGGCDRQTSGEQQGAPAADAGPVQGLDRSQKGKAFADVAFADPEGVQTNFEGFLGTPTLVNLWATWCAPCVKELPTLNAVAKAREGRLRVVPISQDMGPQPSVEAFLAELKLDELEPYHDPKMALSGALAVQVLPTTILYDSQGREVWRYVGDLDWTGEEAAQLLAEAR